MNKTALKKFATEARRELIEKVQLQALKIGISKDKIEEVTLESSDTVFVVGQQLSNVERKQRENLIKRIKEIGYDRVMEEAAYTWFNRFIALRFMEVNDYLPTGVRVLSSSTGSNEPDMFKEVMYLDLDIDKERVASYQMNNQQDELFKYLIKVHCHDLNRYMPFMFEKVEDYTEILFPDGLLQKGALIEKMTDEEFLSSDNWNSVEVIGWLYQYYISDEKDRVIKAKKRYKKEEIPFATQLFTPEWIVRYMVQNTLGRYWVESHEEDRDLISNWEYYLENSNPRESDKEKIKNVANPDLKVEEIKCFDPAMGSGHILSYMFDVLYEIYQKNGYTKKEIPRLIIEKNLYGLDIDDRAYQLACFALVMKAQSYNSKFLNEIKKDKLNLNLASIQETNYLSSEAIEYFNNSNVNQDEQVIGFINQFFDAKSIGSLLKLGYATEDITKTLKYIDNRNDLFISEYQNNLSLLLTNLIKQTEIMNSEYDILVTNPPYIGNKYLSPELASYLNKHYKTVKTDVFSAFIDYSFSKTKTNGHIGFMSPFVWMFISSYEKLRQKIIDEKNISSLVQLEYSGFDSATVPICTFTLRNTSLGIDGEYIKLSDFAGALNQPLKTKEAVQNPLVKYRYRNGHENYKKIPGSPIAYWASDNVLSAFENGTPLGDIVKPKQGLATANNDRFLRYWWEVDFNKIKFDAHSVEDTKNSDYKWYPYNKGGERRQWYGNYDYVVNWEDDGREIKNFTDDQGKVRSRPQNTNYYFKEAITWSDVTSGGFSIRWRDKGSIHDVSGMSAFTTNEEDLKYILGILSTKVSDYIFKMLNPTLHLQIGNFTNFPLIYNQEEKNIIIELVNESIQISESDWNINEVSWNFTNPSFKKFDKIEDYFDEFIVRINKNFVRLVEIENEVNKRVISLYDLQDVLDNDIYYKDITLHYVIKDENENKIYNNSYVWNSSDLVKRFISYFIGVLFGRYALNNNKESIRQVVENDFKNDDNIIPILSFNLFKDDIIDNLVNFLNNIFDSNYIEENLSFIADALVHKPNETSRETIRRYFLNDFYNDHVKMYKKRPIYWQFSSGKLKAFNCLIYIHRYDKTTLSRIRTDYLHVVQSRMDVEYKDLQAVINGDYPKKEITAAKKEIALLEKKIKELKDYDELLHHMADQMIEIDLDDGVKHNYELFKGLVTKIK